MAIQNKTVRFLFGDQLNFNHSWFNKVDDTILYVMMEVRQETDYVKHHIHKVLAFFAAMREFAKQLQELGRCHDKRALVAVPFPPLLCPQHENASSKGTS